MTADWVNNVRRDSERLIDMKDWTSSEKTINQQLLVQLTVPAVTVETGAFRGWRHVVMVMSETFVGRASRCCFLGVGRNRVTGLQAAVSLRATDRSADWSLSELKRVGYGDEWAVT